MTSVKTPSQPEAAVRGLHDRTGFLFGKIGWRATRLFAAALEPMGLRPKHYGVLNFLDAHPGASQQELGATMRIDPSSVVAIIDDFERAGVAERRRDPTDRRRYAVHLTRRGKALLQRAREAALAPRLPGDPWLWPGQAVVGLRAERSCLRPRTTGRS